MTTQLGLDLGRARRDDGIKRVSAPSRAQLWLEVARQIARAHIFWNGTVTIDDVRDRLRLSSGLHHNLWGAVFNDRRFVPVGDTQARYPAAHARRIRRWGLRRTA